MREDKLPLSNDEDAVPLLDAGDEAIRQRKPRMSLTTLFARRTILSAAVLLVLWTGVASWMSGVAIGMLIEWTIAVAVGAAVLTVLLVWIRNGDFSDQQGWVRLLILLFLAFICTWLTKWLQVTFRQDYQPTLWANFGYAWFRRFDDVSFWTMIAGLVVCSCGVLFLHGMATTLSWRRDRKWIWLWLGFAVLALAAYLVAVGVYDPKNKGTFFWRGGSSDAGAAIVKLLQLVEGAAVVLFIAIAHLLHIAYLKGIWSYFNLSPAARARRGHRIARYGLVPAMYCLLLTIGAATFVGNGLGLFDTTTVQIADVGSQKTVVVPGHFSRWWTLSKYPEKFGNKPHYDYKTVLTLSAFVWWPFVGPGVVGIVAWVRSTRRSATAAPSGPAVNPVVIPPPRVIAEVHPPAGLVDTAVGMPTGSTGTSRLERLSISELLPNPTGQDAGFEEVVLRNAGDRVDLAGWSLLDQAGNTFALNGTIAPGAKLTVTLPAGTMPLNNNGDSVSLVDKDGAVVHHVSFTAGQVRAGLRIGFP